MRIISNFRDYYDPLAKYDDDRETLFIRKRSEEVDLGAHAIPTLPWGTLLFVYFCGDTYVAAHFYPANVIVYGRERILEHFHDRGKWPKHRQHAEAAITRGVTIVQKYAPEHEPIFTVKSWSVDWDRGARLDPSPRLGKLGFAKILAPHLAWNTLRNWTQNKARPGRPIPEMDNDTKIVLAGFDPVFSFRRQSIRKSRATT